MKKNPVRPILILGNRSLSDVTEDVCRPISRIPRSWLILMGISLLLTTYGGYCLWMTWWDGIGMWGENYTINWAWDITNFVWWIGIGHAGTLISAILLLFRQKWRNSINRSAEAMTLCAVVCSAIFIFAHMGRPWVGYWILPLPNAFGNLWVNFNSALVWDTFAIGTYLTVSLIYWYMGLLPDFATIRERTKGIKRIIYGIASFGWTGSAWHWRRYESMMLVLAGLATPLVVSVHTIVSMDFSTGIVPGWHSTIFPPYFVAGAIFSGFAMVITLMLVVRVVFRLQNYITVDHLDSMNQIIILNGGIIAVAYLSEVFISWYSGNAFEKYQSYQRMFGDYSWAFVIMMICNVVSPQLLWIKSLRRNILFSFVLSIVINIGMWVERFVIIVNSLHRDFLPSAWNMFYPTMYDVGVFLFSLGFFFTSFLLFARFFPVINMAEVKSLVKENRINQTSIPEQVFDLPLPSEKPAERKELAIAGSH